MLLTIVPMFNGSTVIYDHLECVSFDSRICTSDDEARFFASSYDIGPGVDVIHHHFDPHLENFLFGPREVKEIPDPDYLSEKRQCTINQVTFTREDKKLRIVFDGTGYIANDENKTIRTIRAGGILNLE